MKSLFLVEAANGDILPIKSSKESDLVSLTIKGYPNTGLERCPAKTLKLPKDSQFVDSILPELKTPYKVKVEATYRDYVPLTFDILVKFKQSFDKNSKIVELGSHVFYRNSNGP
jgi:hypothetical protein